MSEIEAPDSVFFSPERREHLAPGLGAWVSGSMNEVEANCVEEEGGHLMASIHGVDEVKAGADSPHLPNDCAESGADQSSAGARQGSDPDPHDIEEQLCDAEDSEEAVAVTPEPAGQQLLFPNPTLEEILRLEDFAEEQYLEDDEGKSEDDEGNQSYLSEEVSGDGRGVDIYGEDTSPDMLNPHMPAADKEDYVLILEQLREVLDMGNEGGQQVSDEEEDYAVQKAASEGNLEESLHYHSSAVEPKPSQVLSPLLLRSVGVQEDMPIPCQIEVIRIYLEDTLGVDVFLHAYEFIRGLGEGGFVEEEQAVEIERLLGQAGLELLPLLHKVIELEQSYF